MSDFSSNANYCRFHRLLFQNLYSGKPDNGFYTEITGTYIPENRAGKKV